MKRPANLIYALNEKPPLGVSLALGLQHILILFISLTLPVLVVKAMGSSVDPDSARSFISLSMIAGGAVTIMQAARKGAFGSGYFCPEICGPSYLSASLLAAQCGGFPLLFGMTLLAGAMEAAFSRLMHRLRFLFPSEVTGIVVALVGIVLIPIAARNFFGAGAGGQGMRGTAVLTGAVTLGTMVGINIWSRGRLRLYGTLVGLVAGYLTALFLGVLPYSDLAGILHARTFAFPYVRGIAWRFDFTLLIPFAVATICSTFKTVGDLVTCQKINDADWRRPEMGSVAGGILVDGLGGVIPGLIGGFGQSTSSSNIGLSIATGATSRALAWSVGGIAILLAFLPRFAGIFMIMPPPVMGATLIFAVSFMIVTGFQIMMSRMLDARKIFVIGISVILGLSADMVPGIYAGVHPWIKPVFSSSLSLGAVTAILLNLVMRIGIAKHAVLELLPGTGPSEDIFDFMERQGGAWGARREVVYRAAAVLDEFRQTVSHLELTREKIRAEVTFDEFNLNLDVSYAGTPIRFPEVRPTEEEILSGKEGLAGFSAFLMQGRADKVTSSLENGLCRIRFHFDH